MQRDSSCIFLSTQTIPHSSLITMKLPFAAFTTLAIASTVAAVDVCTYTQRNCITGAAFGCCSNVPIGACCFWTQSILGWSVRFRNMTGNWLGTTSPDQNCGVQAAVTGASAGATTACVSVATTSTTNWFSARWSLNGTVVAPGPTTRSSSELAECRLPDVLGFTWANRDYRINVPGGQYDEVAQLLEVGDFEALTRFGKGA
ncbi:hypothetical protein D9611_009495 [Ephemerocybe angulata]|uniref:Uncharacterized protein n=1 Tax=Ephemerocybe angulata TaxID=980116 RepID=A0A8H5ETD3_9AGAR|nr:hypothetical protein D9611_009495 [Tulosesus angulatus]